MRLSLVTLAALLLAGVSSPVRAADTSLAPAAGGGTSASAAFEGATTAVPSSDPSWLSGRARAPRDLWHVSWADTPDAPSSPAPIGTLVGPAMRAMDEAQPAAQPPLHAAAVEYSDAYQTRRKIHKYASFAMLPLFATEFALGQSMYNTTPGDTSSRRGLHAAVGAGIVGLFGVNTVTGAWNLFGEGWQDPNGRTLRLIHGLLMMAADVGFLATTQSGPNSRGTRGALTFETDKVTHRNIAVASMSVATVSYLIMLFGNH